MKKMLAMLLAVLTLCFGAAAMAESVPEVDDAAEQAALTDLTANGQLIEGWHVTFKDGKVVEHGAEKNASLLAELLSTDENSNRIGEVAFVPASSPINRSGVLFFNTLFDENAACHIAFGAGYPTNIKGGSAMTRAQLMEKGLNDSAIHEDVMIGAPDTHITGTTKDGQEVTIFVNGEWAF